jgi:hypothetical protein
MRGSPPCTSCCLDQRAGLTNLVNHHDPLTVAQAHVLPAAINLDRTPDYETWREDHIAAEQQLKDRRLIRTTNETVGLENPVCDCDLGNCGTPHAPLNPG